MKMVTRVLLYPTLYLVRHPEVKGFLIIDLGKVLMVTNIVSVEGGWPHDWLHDNNGLKMITLLGFLSNYFIFKKETTETTMCLDPDQDMYSCDFTTPQHILTSV